MNILSWLYDVPVSSASELVVIAIRHLLKKIWAWIKSMFATKPVRSETVSLNLTYQIDLPVAVFNDQVELDIQLHTVTIIRVRR